LSFLVAIYIYFSDFVLFAYYLKLIAYLVELINLSVPNNMFFVFFNYAY